MYLTEVILCEECGSEGERYTCGGCGSLLCEFDITQHEQTNCGELEKEYD